MTTCIDAKEFRSNQAPWGIPKHEPASSRGGGSDSLPSGTMNPGGASGRHHCAMAIDPKLLASLHSEASSRKSGACAVVGHCSWGSDSSSRNPVSSAGLGKVIVSSSSMTSNMERLNRLPLPMRGTRHLCRSWPVPQSIPGGTPDCTTHCWKAQA